MKKLLFIIGVLGVKLLITSALNWNSDLRLKFTRTDREDGKAYDNQLSIVLVFDTTVSRTDFDNLRDTCFEVLEKLEEGNFNDMIYNYILVPFSDSYESNIIKTRDKKGIKSAINKIKIHTNKDCQDPVLTSLIRGLDTALPKSIAFVFTDASASDANRRDEVLKMISDNNFTIIFFVTNYCNNKMEEYAVYNRIARKSKGKLHDLNPNQITTVLDFVQTTLDKKQILLDYFSSEYRGNYSLMFTIDNTMTNFSVSITGKDIEFTLVDPNGIEYEDYLVYVQLSTVKVIIVKKPIIGKWMVIYQSSVSNSIKIFSYGLLSFKFGFSPNLINNITDTKFTPHKGNNYLYILPSNVSLLNSLTDIELVFNDESFDIEDEVIFFKFPLLQMNAETNEIVYRTERFSSPNTAFKIYINGYDNARNPIRRLLSSQISPKDRINQDSLPEVSIEIKHHDRLEDVQVTCRVISLVPVNIQWLKDDVFIKEKDSDYSAELSLEVAEISTMDSKAGELKCFSRSMNGDIFSTVNITDILSEINNRIQKEIDKKLIKIQKNMTDESDDYISQTVHNSDNSIIGEPYDKDYIITPKNRQTQEYLKHAIYSEIIEVLVGSSLNLSCDSSEIPASLINWLYNNNDLDIMNKSLFYSNKIIHFEHIKIDDEGNYTCVVKDIFGVVQRSFIVVVLYPPKVIGESRFIIKKQLRSDFVIECLILSNPKSEFQWTKVNPESGDEMIINSTDSHLIVNSIQESSSYKCQAKNKYGITDVIFDVVVQKPPAFKNNADETLISFQGHNVILDCELETNISPTKIFWLKDNENIYYHNMPRRKNVKTFKNDENLVVYNLRQTDEGNYICYVHNDIDYVQKRFTLIVRPQAAWTIWSKWSSCSRSCDLGVESRTRNCVFSNGTENDACLGNNKEFRKCFHGYCNTALIWGEWSNFSACSKTCYDETLKQKSLKQRFRRCITKELHLCGDKMYEDNVVECQVPLCKINGGWSRWYRGPCSTTCGDGQYTEHRYCNNPSRKNGGLNCIGPNTKYVPCIMNSCDFQQTCKIGFSLNTDLNRCEDIDECQHSPCANNESCINKFGFYICHKIY